MTTSKPAALSIDEFCHRVELACLDLPDQQRRRLVADLTVHLAELDDLEALGTPENYAGDLREAMELPRSPHRRRTAHCRPAWSSGNRPRRAPWSHSVRRSR